MTEKQQELVAAAHVGQGNVRIVPTDSHGDVVMAAGISFARKSGGRAEASDYVSELHSLLNLGLLKPSPVDQSQLFVLTEQGKREAGNLPRGMVEGLRQKFTGRMGSM